MSLSKIWVFAEASDGKVDDASPSRCSTKARELADTVEAFYAGADADCGRAGARRPRCHEGVRDRRSRRCAVRGPRSRQRSPTQIEGGSAPDLIMFGTTYDGRDVVGRLSVKLDRPVLTNNVDVAVDGDSVRCTTPIFGGNTIVTTKFTGGGPDARPAFRPKSFAAEESGGGAAAVVSLARARRRRRRRGQMLDRHVEERDGPEARRGRTSSSPVVAASARPSKYQMIEDLGEAARRARRARPAPSSTPAGCPTRTRWARPARS